MNAFQPCIVQDEEIKQTPSVIQQRNVPGHLFYFQPQIELTWIHGGLDLYVGPCHCVLHAAG